MHKRFFSLLLILMLISPFAVVSQNRIDSLKTLLSNTTTDTLIFHYGYSISLDYIKKAPDSSIKYINIAIGAIDKEKYKLRYYDAINLKGACFWFNYNMDSAQTTYSEGLNYAIVNNDSNMIAKISNNIGVTYQYMGEIDSAEKHLSKAFEVYKQIDDKKALAKAALDLGGIYTSENRYDLAIEKLLNGLDILEDIKDTLYLIHGYNSIGNLYLNIEKPKLALKYYKKSLELDQQSDQGNISDELYCNIGMVYFQDENTYDSAEYYFQKALSKEGIINNHLLYTSTLVNLATLKNNQKKYKEAIKYFKIVEGLKEENADPNSKMACYVNMGAAYLDMGEIKKAQSKLKEGLKRAIELNSLEFQKNAYKLLSKCDSIQGDYQSAYYNYILLHDIELKIHNSESENRISLLNSKNKLDQIKELNSHLEEQNKLKHNLIKKQKSINTLIIIALVLTFLIFLFTYYLYNKSKRLNLVLQAKNEEINKQKEEFQLLNGQLNKLISIVAHDLKAPFNSLLGLLNELDSNSSQYTEEEKNAIIKGLLQNTKSTYHLLENLMEWSISKTGMLKMTIQKVNMLKIVNEVLTLNKIQIENKLLIINNQVNPHADVLADPKMTFTILANLINNAIKFTHSSGIINLKTETINQKVRLTIADNGIGIEEKYLTNIFSIDSDYQTRGTENEYGTGLGLKVVAEFTHRMNGKVSVRSVVNQGTEFILELPIYQDNAQSI